MSSSSAAAPAAAPSAPEPRPLAHLERAVERLTPLSLAERAWDNVGIMVEAPTVRTDSKRRIVLCNDRKQAVPSIYGWTPRADWCPAVTTQVCDEALAHPDIFAILAYHPPIFGGLKSITLANPLQRSLLRCVASGVSVYAIHTASDSAVGGVNDYMASGLLQAAGVKTDQDGMIQPGTGNGSKAITPAKDVPEGQAGAGGGRLVDLLEASGGRKLARHEAVQAVKERLNLKYCASLCRVVRTHHSDPTHPPRAVQAAWSPTGVDEIQTVAICAGSGAGVLKGVPADLYLTGEMSHVSRFPLRRKSRELAGF